MNIEPAFDWGHVAVTGLWSLVALALLAIGVRGSQLLEIGGLAALGVTIASFAAFTVPELDHVSGWSALILAGACASAALLHGLLASRPLPVIPAAAVALGALLSGFASYQLLSEDRFGYGLLAAAAAHLVVAAAVWRKRELATCFWVAGAVLAFVAAGGPARRHLARPRSGRRRRRGSRARPDSCRSRASGSPRRRSL